MENLKELKFYTKTGTCSVTAARITLKLEGIIGKASQGIYGNSIKRALYMYALIGIVALGYGIWSIVNKSYFTGGLFIFIGAFLSRSVIISRNNSATNVIDHSSVQRVETHPTIPHLHEHIF